MQGGLQGWSTPVNIQGMNTEIVNSYKYLCILLNNKLDWTENTNAQERSKQTLPGEETQILWGTGGTTEDLFLTLL